MTILICSIVAGWAIFSVIVVVAACKNSSRLSQEGK